MSIFKNWQNVKLIILYVLAIGGGYAVELYRIAHQH